MSEEILRALTQLFAIISRQDGGGSEDERNYVRRFYESQLNRDAVSEYMAKYDAQMAVEKEAPTEHTSVKDSAKTLAICRKINATLTQKQKIYVMIKLLELVKAAGEGADARRQMAETVAQIFNCSEEEYSDMAAFVKYNEPRDLDLTDVLTVSGDVLGPLHAKFIYHPGFIGHLHFLQVESVSSYFVKYTGDSDVLLNGLSMKPGRTYIFSPGSTVRPVSGNTYYYSKIVRRLREETIPLNFSYEVRDVSYSFPDGTPGVANVSLSEAQSRLIGIMGASGSGKSTLLNILAGIQEPGEGEILLNGVDIKDDEEAFKGMVGYVPQDDIVSENLTVYENLYFKAKLSFRDKSDMQVRRTVHTVLHELGLFEIARQKVGSVLKNYISGGQRKRLNIALELIREPAILFVDEPTSGLSSHDSERVIDLLKELAAKGKLIFVVIHQPSSDIYKMFDSLLIMDLGGLPIYYGDPVEAVVYFKRATDQVDSDRGQCQTCGNVNPEQLFNLIEGRVVNEHGHYTSERKVTPEQWSEMFRKDYKPLAAMPSPDLPDNSLQVPGMFQQFWIYLRRDVIGKLANQQYVILNLLEAPLLALLLAFVIRYENSPDGDTYLFRYNDNMPAYLLMVIVVALFVGLTLSAEEIIKDRKVLLRERYLNLSHGSYLLAKVCILFFISAIQSFLFVMVANAILDIEGMYMTYWLTMFSVACFANVLGLNISDAFNSAVTVYILIPILLIPQLMLSGAIFSFDHLNSVVGNKEKVPIIADLMASRWAFEAMAVRQFKENAYEEAIFPLDQQMSEANYNVAYLIPELRALLQIAQTKATDDQLTALRHGLEKLELSEVLTRQLGGKSLSDAAILTINQNLDEKEKEINGRVAIIERKKDRMLTFLGNQYDDRTLGEIKNNSYNESIADLVTNSGARLRIEQHEGKLLQHIDPIFQLPQPRSMVDFRAHFFSPYKYFAGKWFDTFRFDLAMIWIMSLLLFIMLRLRILKRMINLFQQEEETL